MTAAELVVGAVDLHCHHGPDPHRARSVDAAEAVREAEAMGLGAIVLKSHAYPTGPVALLMQKTVERLRVFGGICCDHEVGGLNPAAVEVALRTGAKIVWMPTFSSVVDRRKLRLEGPGIPVIDEGGRLVPAAEEILRLARQYDAVVATGHIDLPELFAVVDGARTAGVRVLMTHALETQVGADHTLGHVEALAERGALIEFTYLTCMPGGFAATHDPATFAAAMMRIGPARVVMSTDFGQAKSPHPAEGMRMFIAEMLAQGVPPAAVEQMAKRNALRLLGIGE
ncbi:MAG TPA: DUF6282 family protein [Candidatus Limnocylindria bacterium]|nr:DUF6282 family protein [Candidatus Limnocylindria bacterium]